MSTREIIKVSRDVTEATPLAYLARAPLELVPCPGWSEHLTSIPIKPPVLLLPRSEKKPLIVETVGSAAINKNRSKEASSVKVDEVDKTSAAIVEPKDDRIDTIPEAPESQNDNVSKRERDETSKAKIDEVAEKENGEVPQVCASTADVEQATEAPQQRQQQQLNAAAVRTSEDDAAQCVQQRTAEQIIDVPDDAGTSAQQRNELLSKLSKWMTRRQLCSRWTKSRSMRRRERRDRCELGVHQLARARSREPCESS